MGTNIRLRVARIAKELTQLELAEKVGMKEIEISRIETGRSEPNRATKERIAEVLQKTVYELFNCGQDNEQRKGAI